MLVNRKVCIMDELQIGLLSLGILGIATTLQTKFQNNVGCHYLKK